MYDSVITQEMYDSVITQEDCEREQKRFLKKLGLKSMDEFNRIAEECDYDPEKIRKKLGVE